MPLSSAAIMAVASDASSEVRPTAAAYPRTNESNALMSIGDITV
jgi:hypothetical protein